ncbi:hypothetical protein PYW08_010726 [Mythimna loreyi]|uniref:Uncharacterized protein n=1 Tax=Mythimna loreyi TaxID=667449 RepID=A0ACC2Q5R4_9NEOP|nr:hypothetical protein PYW08_010726 [Mythimna loreyi]
MALFTYIVLLAILNIMLAKDCVKNNVPEQMAFEKQLRKDLSCDDFRLTPPNNTSTFTVNLMFLIRQFSVDSVAGVMTLHSWMVIRWKDERLKWDPDKYYGIKSTKMISINMWTPGIRLFNSADPNDFDRYYYVWCDLDNTGDVVCALRIIHNARCSVRLSNWPYDQQQCSFEFGAWTTKLEHFRINVTSPRFEPLVYAQYRTGWAITEHTREVNFSSERQLKKLFKLRREAAGLGAIVVYPAVVLTVLSVTTVQTMALFTYIVLLAILNITLAEDCVINNVPERMAFEKQLRKDLSCDDFRLTPPTNSSDFTVNARFIIKQFNFDSVAGVMTLQTWMYLRWKDERLKWDPDKYYGIKSTNMISIDMWNPGIRLFNSADSHDFDRFYYVWCVVINTGDVQCVVKVSHNAMCSVNLRDWPYDQQRCSFEFGAWTTKSEHFKINVTSRHIVNLEFANNGGEWAITVYSQAVHLYSERQLELFFTLRREAAGLGAIVVCPAGILTVLSITSLFLDVRRLDDVQYVINDDIEEQIVLEVPELLNEDPGSEADDEGYR